MRTWRQRGKRTALLYVSNRGPCGHSFRQATFVASADGVLSCLPTVAALGAWLRKHQLRFSRHFHGNAKYTIVCCEILLSYLFRSVTVTKYDQTHVDIGCVLPKICVCDVCFSELKVVNFMYRVVNLRTLRVATWYLVLLVVRARGVRAWRAK